MFNFFRRTKKEKNRDKMQYVKDKGKAGEAQVAVEYQLKGYEVERTPHGKDFTVRRRDLWTGRVKETKHIEVKTGNAQLSDLQRKTEKEKKGNYKIERRHPIGYECGGFLGGGDIFRESRSPKSRRPPNLFSGGDLFGLSGGRKKKQPCMFSGFDIMGRGRNRRGRGKDPFNFGF